MSPDGESTEVANPLRTRRGFWTFAIGSWAFLVLVGVAVGLLVHASASAFVFTACLLTAAAVFWIWVIRRLLR